MQFKLIRPANDQSFISWVYDFSHEEDALSILINNQEQKWMIEFNDGKQNEEENLCCWLLQPLCHSHESSAGPCE